MKYYIINNETDQQEGPYELDQLADAGVTPETYVWCKGMPDWQQAAEVPDICRLWRNRLYDIMHPGTEVSAQTETEQINDRSMGFRLGFMYHAGQDMPEINEIKPDISQRPKDLTWAAILSILFCNPIGGFIAIYYCYMSQSKWRKGEKEAAHEMYRLSRMWIGLSIFMGLILLGILLLKAH